MKSRFGTSTEEPPSSPEGQVGESDSQALRTLAEEIARDFAPRLDETTLVLYDRDPEHLQAQWYVTPETLAEVCSLFPGEGADLRQVLRLCRSDREGGTEVVASVPQGSDKPQGTDQYEFALPGDGGEYECELGLESDDGGWLLLARSNRVRLADRNSLAPRTAPAPDDTPAQDASCATAEQPEESEEMPVEAALAALGEPLHPVFPNLELDDAPLPECPALPEETPDQAGPENRRQELSPGAPPYPTPYLELDDALPPGSPAPPEEMPGQTGPEERKPEHPPSIPPYPAPYLKLGDAPPGHPEPLEETLGQAGLQGQKPEYPPGVPPYLVSSRELDDAPPERPASLEGTPRQEASGQAGSHDWKPEFPPGIPDYLKTMADTPVEEGVAKGTDLHPSIPSPQAPSLRSGPAPHLSPVAPAAPLLAPPAIDAGQALSQRERDFCDTFVEAALAAVGEPLYPVFPSLELDDLSPGLSAPLEETLDGAWTGEWRLESPPGVPPYPAPYLGAATELPPGADLVAMPPPLLPSSPGPDTATGDMPGPLYDPRAALSSAVLSRPPVSDMEIHAELIVHGRAAPGSSVDLFGHPIPVGADGRFYIRHPLDISALQSLAAGEGLLAWLKAAGHG